MPHKKYRSICKGIKYIERWEKKKKNVANTKKLALNGDSILCKILAFNIFSIQLADERRGRRIRWWWRKEDNISVSGRFQFREFIFFHLLLSSWRWNFFLLFAYKNMPELFSLLLHLLFFHLFLQKMIWIISYTFISPHQPIQILLPQRLHIESFEVTIQGEKQIKTDDDEDERMMNILV